MKIVIPTSDTSLEDLQAAEGNEARNAARPKALALKAIHIADSVFQPRLMDENPFASESHIKELVRVLATRDEALDPILVTPIGKRFFVIDGFHRIGAYRTIRWKKPVPVEIFEGSLKAAWEEALTRNIKNKLPMTHNSKLEMAWRFVKLGPTVYSKARIEVLTTISEGTIGTMRRVLKQHGKEVRDLPWSRAKSKQWDNEEDADADWRQQKVERLMERLRTSGIGAEMVKNPDIFADAAEMIDRELPEQLCAYWLETAKQVVEQEATYGRLDI